MSSAASRSGPDSDHDSASESPDHGHTTGIDMTDHVLTRIGLEFEPRGEGWRFSIPSDPVLFDPDGHVNFGVLGVFLDMAASQPPEMHERGHFVHADITIHRLRRPEPGGRLYATAWTARMGRRSGVIEMDLHDSAGTHVARSVQEVVFPGGSPPLPSSDGTDARTEFFSRLVGECTLDRPLNDAVGIIRDDDPNGPRWSIPLLGSNRNGFGGLHGGVATALVDAAAAGAVAHATGKSARTTSAAVRYLLPSMVGPFQAVPEVIRTDSGSAQVVVRVHDTGADNRMTILADVAVELTE